MTVPYVHSGYDRIPDDNYQTIDDRCVKALLDTWWDVEGAIVDPCAPQGSGIVDHLQAAGRKAYCQPSIQFADDYDWVVTNPPYARGLVDRIATHVVERVRKCARLKGAALLMRASWDMAASRRGLFSDLHYRGQTRMRFRPWWSAERKAQPIHNYVWHVWTSPPSPSEPVVRYWPS